MKEKILDILCVLLFLGGMYAFLMISTVYEEHQLCMNGAQEHCIEQDFE